MLTGSVKLSAGIIKRVEVYRCSDIVSLYATGDNNQPDLGDTAVNVLFNPCNPSLAGTALAYFPRGGPLPKAAPPNLSHANSWGGMDTGPDLLYPAETVDGRVSLEGGKALRAELAAIVKATRGEVAVGNAVETPATERLGSVYGYHFIVHTPPPFANHPNGHALLTKCYVSAIRLAADTMGATDIATPLLGSGTCGFAIETAFRRFVQALKCCLLIEGAAHTVEVLRLVLPSQDDAKVYGERLSKELTGLAVLKS